MVSQSGLAAFYGESRRDYSEIASEVFLRNEVVIFFGDRYRPPAFEERALQFRDAGSGGVSWAHGPREADFGGWKRTAVRVIQIKPIYSRKNNRYHHGELDQYHVLNDPKFVGKKVKVNFFDDKYAPGAKVSPDSIDQMVLTKDYLDPVSQQAIQNQPVLEGFQKAIDQVQRAEGLGVKIEDIEFYHTHYVKGEAFSPGDYYFQDKYKYLVKKHLMPGGTYSAYAVPITGEVLFRHSVQ